jgi:hypothetical protein
MGWFCVNVDAALFPADQRMGLGAVIHNNNGYFILSLCEGARGFPPPEMAEALAVQRALVASRDHGVRKVVLVSDCLSLIHRLVSPRQDRSILNVVIKDIKTLTTDFESCLFKFSSHSLNVAAHKLNWLGLLSLWFVSYQLV